jgi:uncharacterized protein
MTQKESKQKKTRSSSTGKRKGSVQSARTRKPGKPSRTTGKKTTAGGNRANPVLKTLGGLLVLGLCVAVFGLWVHWIFPPETVDEAPVLTGKPAFEVYPEEDLLQHQDETDTASDHEPVVMPFPKPREPLPRVAIIIDDIGYSRSMARKFGDLSQELTFSVLPHSPHQREIAAEAYGKGIEIMLHLPMEPIEYPKVNPGPGALLLTMNVDDMLDTLEDDLEDVPYVVGVNNHMGSRMTSVSTRMYQIFTVLKKRDLFFIDSRTASNSLCKPSARLLQVPFGERDVFLDHSLDKKTVRKQLKALIRVAKKTGQAIGIGHPHKVTYDVLSEELPELLRQVRLVHASEMVKILG